MPKHRSTSRGSYVYPEAFFWWLSLVALTLACSLVVTSIDY